MRFNLSDGLTRNMDSHHCEDNRRKLAPITICITGAAGRIAYSLIQSLAKGDVFGHEQLLNLHLLDIEQSKEAMEGVAMEIEDMASHVVDRCVMTTSLKEALAGADVAVLIASVPHLPGMERKDLLKANARIFKETGEVLEKVGKRSIKVLVVANPSNTNALLCQSYAPSIPKTQFTGLSMLDHNRTLAQLAPKINATTDEVSNVVVWGNHSATMFPDISHAIVHRIDEVVRPAAEMVPDNWARTTLVQKVRSRYSEIMKRRGMTTMSTGKAIADHLKYWTRGTPVGQFVSMALPSDGSYGIEEGVFFSFPVQVSKYGDVKIVPDLRMDAFASEMIATTYAELKTEAEEALEIAAQLK